MTKTIHIIANSKGDIIGCYSSRKEALSNLDEKTVYHFRSIDKLVYEYMLKNFSKK
jgi:hypothetical protein